MATVSTGVMAGARVRGHASPLLVLVSALVVGGLYAGLEFTALDTVRRIM